MNRILIAMGIARMNRVLVCWGTSGARDPGQDFHDAIKRLGTSKTPRSGVRVGPVREWYRHAPNVWIIKTELAAVEVCDELRKCLNPDENVAVLEIKHGQWSTHGLSTTQALTLSGILNPW